MKLRYILCLSALLLLVSLLTGCFSLGGGLFDAPQSPDQYAPELTPTYPTAAVGEGGLWDLQADETCFLVNTTYETRFTVRAEGVSQISLTFEGETICPMVDNGTDGDEIAGDGIFTCTVTNNSDTAETNRLYAVSGNLSSEPVTLCYFAEPTEEALLLFEGAQLTVQAYIRDYSDANGYVSPADVPAVLALTAQFVENLYQRGEVLYYQVYDTHVTAKFASGITAVYAPPLADVDRSGSNVSVYTFQPFRHSYPAAIENYLDFPDNAARLVSGTFPSHSFDGNNDENAVTLDSVRRFGENEVVLWHGHGDYDEVLGPYLITGERYDRNRMMEQAYFEDVIRDRIFCSVENRMAFTAAYVDERCGSLEGSFLYLGSCLSGKDSRLADAFLNKGAVAVVANSDTISTVYNLCMQYQIVEYMTQLNPATADTYTLKEAMRRAKDKLGENDYSFGHDPTRDAYPIIFGGTAAENYQLANVWSGVFDPTESETQPTPTTPPATEPTQPPATQPPAAVGTPYADYQWFLDSYAWVDYVASDLSEIPADQYDAYWMGSYSLYDVNRDGIDELIILCGQSISDTSYNFYSWRDGEIYSIGAIFAGSGLYGRYDGAAGILVRNAHGDIESLTYVDMSWNGLTSRWQREYYYQREDYVDPKEDDWYWIESYSVHETDLLARLAG